MASPDGIRAVAARLHARADELDREAEQYRVAGESGQAVQAATRAEDLRERAQWARHLAGTVETLDGLRADGGKADD